MSGEVRLPDDRSSRVGLSRSLKGRLEEMIQSSAFSHKGQK